MPRSDYVSRANSGMLRAHHARASVLVPSYAEQRNKRGPVEQRLAEFVRGSIGHATGEEARRIEVEATEKFLIAEFPQRAAEIREQARMEMRRLKRRN